MSYLSMPNGIPDISKAIISIWFRIPQSSVDATAAGDRFANHLALIIPLITFIHPRDVEDMEPNIVNIGTAVNFPQSQCPYVPSTIGYQSVGPFFLDPCFIGINCDPDRLSIGRGKPTLVFNLQASGTAVISNYLIAAQNMAVYSLLATPPPTVGDPNVPGNGWNDLGFPYIGLASNLVDFSNYLMAVPENFQVRSPVVITADQWHHLLLSFDLSKACITNGPPLGGDRHATTAEGTTSWCQLWYAIDDVNYNGAVNLQPYAVDGGSDPNAILTDNAWHVANSQTLYIYNLPQAPATCTYSPVPLPTSGVALGLPASAAYMANVHHVEMAEFQMFTGVTLDPAVEANRRIFIGPAGKNSLPPSGPNSPNTSSGSGLLYPIDPKVAETFFGKKPELMLHGSSNWIKGKNTGSLGIDKDGKPIASGQFMPTGPIKRYKPDPTIGIA
jgi:hypothetical protein